MKCSSAKAKGRRACQEVKDMLHEYAPHLKDDDIIVTSSGTKGEDLRLSPEARKQYPFVFEVKNVERLNVWDAIDQADSHRNGKPWEPLVAFKRNNEKLRVIVDLEWFVAMLCVNTCKDNSHTS